MTRNIIAVILLLGLLSQAPASARAAGPAPVRWPYVGIVYREPSYRILGLGGSSGGWLAWFVHTGPSPSGDNFVGGFSSRRTIALAKGAGGTFLLAVPSKLGTKIDRYNPRLNRVTSSITVASVQLAFGAWNPLRVGAGGHLWMLGVVGQAVYLYRVNSANGTITGKFEVPSGANGVAFWLSGHGAIVAVATRQAPDASIGALYRVGRHGAARRLTIPQRLRPFPMPANLRRGVLTGVNSHWQFMRSDIGRTGRLTPIVVKQLDVNQTKVASHPGYFFDLGHDRAVVSSLGNWDAKTERYVDRYLFLISEKTGKILRKAVVPPSWQPLDASDGKVFLLDGGTVYAFDSHLHQSVAASHMGPSPWAVQGATSR